MQKQPVSSEASGGAGTLFEYRVAAVMLSHLLCGSHPPGLQVPVVRVGLQQRVRGHRLDDVVIYGEPGSLSTEFQVKKTLAVTGTEAAFIDVVTQALYVLEDRKDEIACGEHGLGLIAGGRAAAMDELGLLAERAQGHSSHTTFVESLVHGVVRQSLRSRWDHLVRAVEAAVRAGGPNLGSAEQVAHALLAALHVWRPTLSDTGVDYCATLDRLQPVADEFEVTSTTLFSHLAALAEGWGPVAGVVDADSVRRRLRRRGLRESSTDTGRTAITEKIDVDAVVRGPIEALGLADQVALAEAQLAAGDAAAVGCFAAIAESLAAARFGPYATVMLRKRADALQSVGRHDEAVMARAGIAWEELDRVRPWEAGFALHDGRQPGVELVLGAEAVRVQAAVDAAVSVAKGADLDSLIGAFDALDEDDQYALRAAVFVCEEAIAADQLQIVSERLERLRTIGGRGEAAGAGSRDESLTIRLRMGLAEVTGEWIDLLRETHRRQPRHVVAWVHARYARHLALSGDGAGAQENFLEAIERGAAEDMHDEAAHWLYALRTVRFWFDGWHQDDQHPRAQALLENARFSTLPGSPHTAELALQAMLDEGKPHEALQRAFRWRWQAFVRAQLTDEMAAVEAIGTLHQRQGAIETAIENYVHAGSEAEAASAAAHLPEEPVRLDRQSRTAVPNVRAAAYASVAAAADLIDDGEGAAWADHALREVANRPAASTPVHGASPYLRALDALAALSQTMPVDQQEALVSLVEPLIDRPADHYLHSDPAVAEILCSLAGRVPAAVPMLCRALVADQRMAGIILGRQDVLTQHKDVIAQILAPFAANNQYAGLAIILSGADPTPARSLAAVEVDKVLQPRIHEPNTLTGHADGPHGAIFASILDQQTKELFAATMLERALDKREARYSRWNDLTGLSNIAGHVGPSTARKLVPQILEIARGEHDGGPDMDFRSGIELSALALHCASKLGPSPEQFAEIEQIGTAYLRTGAESDQWRVVHALVAVPPEDSRLNLQQCAGHPFAGLRALAGIRWTKDSSTLPHGHVITLARDPDYRVRRELARAISAAQATDPDRTADLVEILAADVRRSVRTLIATASHP